MAVSPTPGSGDAVRGDGWAGMDEEQRGPGAVMQQPLTLLWCLADAWQRWQERDCDAKQKKWVFFAS